MRILVLLSINKHTKFEIHSFTHFKDTTGAQNLKKKHESGDRDHVPFMGVLSPVSRTFYRQSNYQI